MSGKIHASFFAALFYSLISPSALLVPAIREDFGGMFGAPRLVALVFYGGGPQVSGLALLPLAILFLHLALRRRRPLELLLAGVSVAAVALTNAFATVALAIASICLVATHPAGSLFRNLRLALAIGVFSYFAICPWLSPSLLRAVQVNSPTAGGDFRWSARSAVSLAALLIGFVMMRALTRRRSDSYLRFLTLFAGVLTAIVVLAQPFGIHVIPQGNRYHLEMEMALCLLFAQAAAGRISRLPVPARAVLMVAALLFASSQTIRYWRSARDLIVTIDPRQTIEHQTAATMAELFQGRRVMAAGSPSFWLNVFQNTPQLSGGHEPFNLNWMIRVAVFTLFSGMNAGERDAEICILWLKAFGVHGINVPGPGSAEPYRPFRRNPAIFEGLLPVVRRLPNDTIYGVPQRSTGLAYVTPTAALVRRPPVLGLDVGEVERYVAAIEDRSLPVPFFETHGPGEAVIRAVLQPGHVISVQMNYHPGWRATVDGVPQPVFADGLGMMVIHPQCRESCTVHLQYDGGWEARLTRILSALSVGIALTLCFASRFRAR